MSLQVLWIAILVIFLPAVISILDKINNIDFTGLIILTVWFCLLFILSKDYLVSVLT